MKIILDVMGADKGPAEAVRGAADAAASRGDLEILLAGNENAVEEALSACGKEVRSRLHVLHAADVITMDDDPVKAVRSKPDASMLLALRMLRDGEADAAVSAGNTGALVTASTLIVRRAPDVRRAALGAVVPTAGKTCLLTDAGANAECSAEMLLQFAVLGSDYARRILGRKEPSVGLLNIGTESHKGTQTVREAHAMLAEADRAGRIRFAGNVEGRDIAAGQTDVIVCDGFTGNVALKTYEGLGITFAAKLKHIFFDTVPRRIGALPFAADLLEMKRGMDYRETGGAPILGLRKPVIKAHGSSDARAFCTALEVAARAAETAADAAELP